MKDTLVILSGVFGCMVVVVIGFTLCKGMVIMRGLRIRKSRWFGVRTKLLLLLILSSSADSPKLAEVMRRFRLV